MPPRPSIPADDLYARLEVAPDATSETIEIAWRALLKRHHPDIAGHEALEVAKRINVAHDWLSDPSLRERYDRERRGVGAVRGGGRPREGSPPRPRWSPPPPAARRPPADPADTMRRFLDRVGRLSPVELDRLAVAETRSIAFVASIHRFLDPERVEALAAVEREVRSRLAPADWADPQIRDAILAAAHELVLAPFLDEHLSEPFRGRARDRLMRGWEAAVGQPRYGPSTAAVERFVERASELDAATIRRLAASAAGGGDAPWPRGLDPEEDEGLRVSCALAIRDVGRAVAPVLGTVEPAVAGRAAAGLRRAVHALVLRHGFSEAELERLMAPWTPAAMGLAPARPTSRAEEPSLRRR